MSGRDRGSDHAPGEASQAAAPAPRWTDDGRPALESGEPILQRWFVLLMLVLVPLGIGFAIWAFFSIEPDPIPVAERLPPGTATVTHERGAAVLNEDRSTQSGPGCASGITLVGDEGARSAGFRALGATCRLLDREEFALASAGMARWADSGGILRFAIFELSGVDASARVEDGAIVVELNPKFQFRDGTEAAPFVIHALVHMAEGWPGAPVSAEAELEAMFLQRKACSELLFDQEPPRGCFDAKELLELDDPKGALVDAGYRREDQ